MVRGCIHTQGCGVLLGRVYLHAGVRGCWQGGLFARRDGGVNGCVGEEGAPAPTGGGVAEEGGSAPTGDRVLLRRVDLHPGVGGVGRGCLCTPGCRVMMSRVYLPAGLGCAHARVGEEGVSAPGAGLCGCALAAGCVFPPWVCVSARRCAWGCAGGAGRGGWVHPGWWWVCR